MILRSFLLALGQTADRRFRRVLGLGVVLALLLLAVFYVGFLQLLLWLTPESVALPWFGPVAGIDAVLGWGSLVLMLFLSVFLMVPVASLFTGLFLEDIAEAVEARHYPGLPPATALPWPEALRQAVNFLGLVILVNALALVGYLFSGPFAPLLFWAVNGFLLGREYFTLVALRRMTPAEAKLLRSRNAGRIWLAGVLMAAPLSLPLVNLLVPVLGVATFTHLVHSMARSAR